MGEGGLRAKALGVVARRHEQTGGGVDAHAVEGQEPWGGLCHEFAEQGVDARDLLLELLDAPAERTERHLGGMVHHVG